MGHLRDSCASLCWKLVDCVCGSWPLTPQHSPAFILLQTPRYLPQGPRDNETDRNSTSPLTSNGNIQTHSRETLGIVTIPIQSAQISPLVMYPLPCGSATAVSSRIMCRGMASGMARDPRGGAVHPKLPGHNGSRCGGVTRMPGWKGHPGGHYRSAE